MDDNKLSRALTWVGGGGSAVAVSALMAAGLFAATPDGMSPAAHMLPCFSPGCTSAGHSVASGTTSTTVKHDGRVTYPAARSVNQEVAAPTSSTTSTTVAKPAPQVWTTSLPTQRLDAPIVSMATARGSLLMVGSDGGVFPVGQAGFFGSLSGKPLSQQVVAVAANPATGGYWLVGRDGGVFSFNAGYHGSLSGNRLTSPVVAMASTPSGNGYWLASSDGGVFAFGDATYYHAISGHRLTSPVVAMAATPSGHGYWLVSQDGGVFAFGDARYTGSLSGRHLTSPVVSMAPTPAGQGYWLVSQDGGVFAFGDAVYRGSAHGAIFPSPVSAIVPTITGQGYWLASRNGRVSAFGDARPVAVTSPTISAVATAATPAPAGSGAAHPEPHSEAHPVSHPSVRAAGKPESPAHRNSTFVIGRGGYSPGTVGVDLSQYQCGDIPGSPMGVAVVQVTGGAIDNAPNPCYVQEAQWAGPNMAAYIYLNGLPSTPPTESLKGPAGHCAITNIACASFNYGYNYARYWVTYSNKLGIAPDTWWLDVERYSGWQDTVSNRLVVTGAINGLRSMHVNPGIYSTAAQWQEITGNMNLHGLAVWTPGAGALAGPGYTAANFCAAPGSYAFGGGTLKMVQYGYQGPFPGTYSGPTTYDLDLAC